MGGDPDAAADGEDYDSSGNYAFQNSTVVVWILCLARSALIVLCAMAIVLRPRAAPLAKAVFTNIATLGVACLGGKALAWVLSPPPDLGVSAAHDLKLFFWVALACGAAFSMLEIILFSRLCDKSIVLGEELGRRGRPKGKTEELNAAYNLLEGGDQMRPPGRKNDLKSLHSLRFFSHAHYCIPLFPGLGRRARERARIQRCVEPFRRLGRKPADAILPSFWVCARVPVRRPHY